MEKSLEAAHDLMRRLPPHTMEGNLRNIIKLVPGLMEDLLQTVDQPLKVAKCRQTGKEYIVCDYNRDGDSYRSPWSNSYDPELPDGTVPSSRLREMEVQANDLFDSYTSLYYDNAVTSCYFWDLEEGFACAVLIKKQLEGEKGVDKGIWDSLHVVEVQPAGNKAAYRLTSTIMLSCVTKNGKTDLSGTLTKQDEKQMDVTAHNTHLVNIGNYIQDMELSMYTTLEQIYFGKTTEIVDNIRKKTGAAERTKMDAMASELASALKGRAAQ